MRAGIGGAFCLCKSKLDKTGLRMPDFKWTKPRERAALLVAQDDLSDEEIARKIGVVRATLETWKLQPAFKERVKGIVEATQKALLLKGITERQNRIDALNDRWAKMRQVVSDRGADPTMVRVPGGNTGLLVRTYKTVGQGANAKPMAEYSVDTGLLKEMRAHEEQAAKELGQWAEKSELTGANGGPIGIEGKPDLKRLSKEELQQLAELVRKTAPAGGD